MSVHILFVDDDVLVVRTLERWAQKCGYEALVAFSSQEAQDVLTHHDVDLVITDLRLESETDGLHLAEILIAEDDTRPVILMTGYADLKSARRAIEVGIFEYFVKPCDFEQLEKGIQRAMETRRSLVASRKAQAQMAVDVASRTRELEILNRKLHAEIELRDWQEKQRMQMMSELEAQRVRAMNADRLQALGEMTAGVAHELNQPLTAISVMAERVFLSMERGVKVSEASYKETFEDILKMVDRMTEIISHMQVFARDTTESEPVAFNLSTVIQDVFKFVGAQLKAHGVQVSIHTPEHLPDCVGWPQQIEEVFLNLITNARYALDSRMEKRNTDQGTNWEPRIEIRVSMLQDKKMFEVSVSDTGNGISPDIESRIFDPFFTTKEVGKGTGLGLSISHSIVQKHNGRFQVDNRPGNGVTFTFSLPYEE